MRILSLNYEFPPIGGGGGNAHKHLLKEFARFDDLQTTLITTTMEPEVYHESYSDNVNIYFLPLPKRERLYWRRSEVLRYLLVHHGFLGKYLSRESFDLCHAFFGFPTGLLAYLHRSRFPYIVSVRGSDVPGYNKRFSLDYMLLRPVLKRIYATAGAVTANSRGLCDLYERQFPGFKADVIPNGVDTETFAPQEKIPRDDFQLVTTARLIPRKGINLLIRACRRISQENIPIQCHIIGDGPEEDSLKKLANSLDMSSQIVFHGAMPKDRVAAFLPQCDAFVLPSYAEGMSNAALEAMACGLPLMLTDTGGSRELVDENGAVVQTGNDEALAVQLIEWLSHPDSMREMGKRSRERSFDFSWKQTASQYRDLYQRVLEKTS